MGKRIVFLDYMRVIACFMVIMVHSCEFFFIDGANIGIRTPGDGFWVSVIDSAFRCSVYGRKNQMCDVGNVACDVQLVDIYMNTALKCLKVGEKRNVHLLEFA